MGVGGWGLGPGWGTCSRALAQHCIHASHLKSAPAHVHRSRATDGVGSWGGVGGGGGGWGGVGSLLVHSSKHCVYKRSGAKKARVQRRSGPACTDDPNSACTDDALTSRVYS